MKVFEFAFAALALLAVPARADTSAAASVRGEASVYAHSCGYYSETVAAVRIVYTNYDLPWGAIVELVYGQDGKRQRGGNTPDETLEWQMQGRQVLRSTAGYEWTGDLDLTVSLRSAPDFYRGVDFVFRLIYPDGRIAFDNGTQTAWGFYRLAHDDRGPCTDGQTPAPPLAAAPISRVNR